MFLRICRKDDGQRKKKRRHLGKLFFGLVLFPTALYTLWRYDQKHPLLSGDDSVQSDDAYWGNDDDEWNASEGQASSAYQNTCHSSAQQKNDMNEEAFTKRKEAQTIHSDDEKMHQETPKDHDDASSAMLIGNSSTKKFHLTQCMAVDKIGETEKTVFHSSEEALAAGFVPCKRCNPTM